ncbi:MAG: peptide ligase PGM1-related protein [Planctomycetota bacterium]
MSTKQAEETEFRELQQRLPELWTEFHERPSASHTCIIVPSLSFDQEELGKVAGVPFYEERLLFFLMRLRRPGARIMYVTSQPVDPDIVHYYLTLLTGVPANHAERRLTMLCLYDATPRALTEKILERPRVVQRIRDWAGERARAYLTCFNSTPLERQLAVDLGIPLLGVDPDLSWIGTKSGGRSVFRDAGVPCASGRERLRTESEVVDALDALTADRPGIRRAVVKLNAGFSGEGNALYTFPQDLPQQNGKRKAALASALDDLKFAAEGHRKDAFLAKFSEMGGVVEEFLEAPEVESPSVQLRINPRRELTVVSTHDQVLGGDSGQVYLGCRFPASPDYRADIIEKALRVGEVLVEQGALGRFSVDFLAVRHPEQDWKCWAVEINLRMTGTTFPFVALQFLTGGSLDADGEFRSQRGVPKYYFATDTLSAPAYRGLLPQDFLEIVIHHGLHFRPSTETGVLFHMIGALSQYGKIGVICVGDTPEEADELHRRTREVLDAETSATSGGRGRLTSLFDDLPHAMD